MASLVRVISRMKGAEAGEDLVGGLRRALGDRSPALLVCFSSMQQPLASVLPALRAAFPSVALVGSSTAGEFSDEGECEEATVVAAVVGDYVVHTAMAEGLREDPDGAAERATQGIPPRPEGYPHRTAILLFDGLVGVGEEVTLACASALGADVRIVGAAAGDDWLIKSSFVGAGERSAADALALAVIDSRKPLGVGVAHGHKTLGERLVVTRSAGSVVHEFDGQPAWKRYADATRRHSVQAWNTDPDSITDPGKRLQFFAWYQTGIEVPGGFKNRTPLARLDDGSLAYACGIPEGTEMEILGSNAEHQVQSAREAASLALRDLGGPAGGALVFECGCRKVYLGERFGEAPRVVSETLGGAPLAGFEAYGEVALNVGDFSGFHNATTVVLAFPGGEE